MSSLPSTMTAAEQRRDALRSYAILFSGIFAFGFSAIFVRAAAAPGYVVAAWRVGVATLLLTPFYLRQPPAARRISRASLPLVLVGGVMFALSLGIFHSALDITTAANATFIGNLAPLWVGLITLFVLHQPLPGNFWLGVIIALAGAGFIVLGGGDGLSGVKVGDVIVFGNSTVWAIYQVVTAQARARLSAITWVWAVILVAAVLLIPLTPLFGYHLTGYDGMTILMMVAAGVISQGGGFVAYNYALGRISAARVSVANMLQPVVTAVAAYLLLGEAFGGWRLVGGGLVLIGVYLSNRPGRTRQVAAPDAEPVT